MQKERGKKMNIDVSRFRVIYGKEVLNAIAIMDICGDMNENRREESTAYRIKPKFLEIITLDTNGNIVIIRDEAWRFQFVPIVAGDRQ